MNYSSMARPIDAFSLHWLVTQPGYYVNRLLLKIAIDIVDLPIKHGDFP